jgi:hypothetical protein
MSRLSEWLVQIPRRGHIDEARLNAVAEAGASDARATSAEPAAPATPDELAHLRACRRCRKLAVGFRRTAEVLGGAWADRPLNRGVEIPEGAHRVQLGRPGRFDRSDNRRIARRAVIPVAIAAILVGVVATAELVALRGGGQPGSSVPGGSMAQATAHGTPQRTGLVARLPLGGQVSWAPDSKHLLVSSETGSVVYDRFGNLVSSFGQFEGWLDATHLISGDGHVASIDEPYTGGPQFNSWVVASGHGSAAIIVAVPGCVGDPIIDWYKNGQYVRAGEKATPYGWSPDGKLVLLGHLDCSDEDAQMHGWKGRVDVVDFASGQILATAPNVRGQMAFNPSATLLAAQSDADLEIVTIAGGQVRTIVGARLLSWLDDSHLFYMAGMSVMSLDVASGAAASVVGSGDWQVPAAAGPRLVVDMTGHALRIVAADGTTLLDLSSASLVVGHLLPYAVSFLEQRWWSPDGRMLALDYLDGTSLALFSVTDLPGSIAGALPTPIGSPQAIVELDPAALPGPVRELVSDAKRDAFWFFGGDSGKPIDLYRYDVATAKLSISPIEGTVYNENEPRDCLAIAPDGKLWIGAGLDLIVYDPETDGQASLALPNTGPDIQSDPQLGQPDPWIAGVAFDASGRALIARNWVRSLAQVDASLHVTGRVDISGGFAMTGGVFVAGGRVFVVADPEAGFGFGVDATGTGQLSNIKFQAPALVAVGDRVLTAGTPPGWIDRDGGGAAMIEPVMASVDLVAAGPDGTAVLYSNATGQVQWRDKEGKVSAQGVFKTGAAPQITILTFDAQGRLWAVELAGTEYWLVRLSLGS